MATSPSLKEGGGARGGVAEGGRGRAGGGGAGFPSLPSSRGPPRRRRAPRPSAGERGAVHCRAERGAQRRGQGGHSERVSGVEKGLGDRGQGQQGGGCEAKGGGAPVREEEDEERGRGRNPAGVASVAVSPRGHEPDQRVQQHGPGKVQGIGQQFEQAQREPARAVDPPDAPGERRRRRRRRTFACALASTALFRPRPSELRRRLLRRVSLGDRKQIGLGQLPQGAHGE